MTTESGKITLGKISPSGNLRVRLFSGKRLLNLIDVDIEGLISKFHENIAMLERQCREGSLIIGFQGEASTSLISDNRECYGVLKVQPPRSFWKDRMKRLTHAEGRVVYRGVIEITSEVKNGHFHRYTSSPLDYLVAESPNFQRVNFPKVREAFEKVCRSVNAFFSEDADFPQKMTVHDSAMDTRGTKVEITVTFSIDATILDSRTALIKAHNNWVRERGELLTKPQKPKPQVAQSAVGQQGMVIAARTEKE